MTLGSEVKRMRHLWSPFYMLDTAPNRTQWGCIPINCRGKGGEVSLSSLTKARELVGENGPPGQTGFLKLPLVYLKVILSMALEC